MDSHSNQRNGSGGISAPLASLGVFGDLNCPARTSGVFGHWTRCLGGFVDGGVVRPRPDGSGQTRICQFIRQFRCQPSEHELLPWTGDGQCRGKRNSRSTAERQDANATSKRCSTSCWRCSPRTRCSRRSNRPPPARVCRCVRCTGTSPTRPSFLRPRSNTGDRRAEELSRLHAIGEGPLDRRIDDFVAMRLRLHEGVGPVNPGHVGQRQPCLPRTG